MKNIKIKSVLTNSENETTIIEAVGSIDESNNLIKYKEEELDVNIIIKEDSIMVKRHNEDYDLNLEFKLNEKIKCNYEVRSIGLNIDLEVNTMKLEIKENYIYVHYSLHNDKIDMGTFEYKLMFWE